MIKKILKIFALGIGISNLIVLLGNYFMAYFIRNVSYFCIDFNSIGEGVFEMIMAVIGIIGLFYIGYELVLKNK